MARKLRLLVCGCQIKKSTQSENFRFVKSPISITRSKKVSPTARLASDSVFRRVNPFDIFPAIRKWRRDATEGEFPAYRSGNKDLPPGGEMISYVSVMLGSSRRTPRKREMIIVAHPAWIGMEIPNHFSYMAG